MSECSPNVNSPTIPADQLIVTSSTKLNYDLHGLKMKKVQKLTNQVLDNCSLFKFCNSKRSRPILNIYLLCKSGSSYGIFGTILSSSLSFKLWFHHVTIDFNNQEPCTTLLTDSFFVVTRKKI